ncbi:MAG: nucleotidyltransferase family protein [Candidatus Paceibacterota bacterium]
MTIDKIIKKKAAGIFKKYGVTKAAVFGSCARGEEKKDSDIDLLVELPEEMTLFGAIALKLELEKALKRKVDLVEYGCIKPVIKESVLSAQIPVI